MKIYFDGCSNTYGAELAEPECSRYSRIVSEHFGAEEHNVSQRGGSDKRMMRNLLETDLEPYDYIIVQLTCKNRTEFWDDSKKRWMQINMDTVKRKGVSKKLNESFSWIDYFKHVYTDKLGNINQLTLYHAMRNVLKDKKHLIIGINGWGQITKAPVDINFTNFKCIDCIEYKTAPGGHVNEEGHKTIAREIIKCL
tara:strand:+ start:636 stop:1223 length:588 start_codon:yes stop_codon:yes gene_type:complete